MKAGALGLLARLVVLALASTAPAAAATIQVTVDKLVFSPASVDAKVGDTIEWVNKDVIAHTATVKGGWEVIIPPKKSASMTLKTAQTVDYFCRFHPNMKGRLLVAP
ncbi:amicyanin [Mesorhizobium sp. B2-3-14]|uniref:Plastocyanin n=1 Tax=Mesorhizobium australicum (strain HAMBI 3006 / LMG 24608 / WSM2073) TaxID=754035 RepID=L0KSH8_MESAW|nr:MULTISPECIES: cupredoxin family copper-binding protein [Mesorhizobium]MBZ9933075.1 cupredoxin family copper-binding protein [Mesorhizobium sp. BR1-1-5]AGB47043.1 plastocyanin [Mesorhizobium australicum WSM2073]MBZ9905047.1 cupredoxin family copper-binding protein [Mesorhizobium sp. BR115XR7A]MBZ9974841.1 cupredoxin family copper-binding protein [Mesorhizobium sp. BR-1-1-10]TPK70039.1 amicyanin [Mesorhizobium sp. B2-4-18]